MADQREIKIQLHYSGLSDDTTFAQFVKYFNYATKDLDDDVKKLKLFVDALRGHALTYFLDNCTAYDSFDDVIAEFTTIFERDYYTLKDFNQLTLEKCKDLEHYYIDKTKIANFLQLDVQLTIQGLHDGMPLYVRRVMSILPLQTTQEWISIARNVLKETNEQPPQRKSTSEREPRGYGNPTPRRNVSTEREFPQRQRYFQPPLQFRQPFQRRSPPQPWNVDPYNNYPPSSNHQAIRGRAPTTSTPQTWT